MNSQILIFLFFFLPEIALAATIKGFVYDGSAGVPLAGATVHLENTGFHTEERCKNISLK